MAADGASSEDGELHPRYRTPSAAIL